MWNSVEEGLGHARTELTLGHPAGAIGIVRELEHWSPSLAECDEMREITYEAILEFRKLQVESAPTPRELVERARRLYERYERLPRLLEWVRQIIRNQIVPGTTVSTIYMWLGRELAEVLCPLQDGEVAFPKVYGGRPGRHAVHVTL